METVPETEALKIGDKCYFLNTNEIRVGYVGKIIISGDIYKIMSERVRTNNPTPTPLKQEISYMLIWKKLTNGQFELDDCHRHSSTVFASIEALTSDLTRKVI